MKTFLASLFALALIYGTWNVFANGIHFSTGDGQHTGYITAVEENGIFFKTWTVYVKTDPQSSQEDTYCLPPQSEFMVTTLKDAADKRSLVTLSYGSWFIAGFKNCNGEADYITQLSAGN